MGYFNSIYAEQLPHRAVAVYMYLKDRSDKDGRCYPGLKTIAKELKIGVSTVQRALDDLIQRGYLRKEARYREGGSQASNYYYLIR